LIFIDDEIVFFKDGKVNLLQGREMMVKRGGDENELIFLEMKTPWTTSKTLSWWKLIMLLTITLCWIKSR
jgi:hypothetical protein